jgi:hypothetical protein
MFLAAFTSRSWTVPHAAHSHSRTCSGLGPSFTPHAEQTWLVGSNWPIFRNSRLYSFALYSSIPANADHPASCTDFASRVRASPFTARSSTVTAWFSRMMAVESLWWKSRRASATCACARDVRVRPRDPHAGLLPVPAAFLLAGQIPLRPLDFLSARRRSFGAAILVPSSSTAK